MKKFTIKMIVLSAIIAGQASADDGYYIGLDLGSTTVEASTKSQGLNIDETENDSGGAQTLKAGYYFDSNNRAAVFYNNINSEDADFGILGLEYDYLFGENDLKPFVGAMLGYGRYSMDDPSFTINGLVYGIQAGVNYKINTNFSVEAGYRFRRSTMNKTYRYLSLDADLAIDNLRSWFIGLNYKFN